MKKEIKIKPHWIELKSGIEVCVDMASQDWCKGCHSKIWWAVTKKKKLIPICLVGLAEWETHFVNCPMADKFRKRGEFVKSQIKDEKR